MPQFLGVNYRTGSWNNWLPEIGLTEAVQKVLQPDNPMTAQGGSNLYLDPREAQALVKQSQPISNIPYGPAVPKSLNNPPSGPLGGGGSPVINTNPTNTGINSIVDNYSSLIDQDYNNQMQALSGQESNLRNTADIAQRQIGNEYQATASQLAAEQAGKVQGVQEQLGVAEAQGKSATQQARDLYRETQMRNVAQLSSMGISSSSVAEALAENLGVETMRRMAGISGSLGEVRQNAVKEMARINSYYSDRRTQLDQSKAIELSKIQQGLLSGLTQINNARNQTQTEQARSRYELLQNARSAVDAINRQVQDFKDSLSRWAESKASAAQSIAENPEWLSQFLNTRAVLEQQYSPTQFNTSP